MSTSTKQRTTLFLDKNLLKQARAEAVIQSITLTSLVEKLLIKCLPDKTVIKKPIIS